MSEEENVVNAEKLFVAASVVKDAIRRQLSGEISENEGHHPDILFGWGYAIIKITTHAIEGLSENDFILAAKIDKIVNV